MRHALAGIKYTDLRVLAVHSACPGWPSVHHTSLGPPALAHLSFLPPPCADPPAGPPPLPAVLQHRLHRAQHVLPPAAPSHRSAAVGRTRHKGWVLQQRHRPAQRGFCRFRGTVPLGCVRCCPPSCMNPDPLATGLLTAHSLPLPRPPLNRSGACAAGSPCRCPSACYARGHMGSEPTYQGRDADA